MPFEETEQFVLTGCSAGGLAAYTWVDYFKDYIHAKNPRTQFFGFPDSGFF
jgi:hypothetical protein